MKIGKTTVPSSAICTSDADTIVVRGKDLCEQLIGKVSFGDYFFLLVTGKLPTPAASAVVNATLVAIAEHGLVPSVQASRMTFAAAPDSLQGGVAAGILGCGTVILGASELAGRFFMAIKTEVDSKTELAAAARAAVERQRAAGKALPGYGHPQHKERDPRVSALFRVAEVAGADMTYIRIAEAVERAIPDVVGKDLRLNVMSAIPAVLLGVGFPIEAAKGIPILARTAGLIAHLTEEMSKPIGFALSYQAVRELQYDGVPAETLPKPHA